ncbi:MAG: glycosyltransferase family A protein [Candidatus Nitrosocaldaceae archaeon]
MYNRDRLEYKPLISIIIPTYKSESYIARTLESLSEQTYKNFEVFIVNRGDIADLENICAKYKFCKVFRLDSERTKAINFGARICNGDYIYYLPSDYVLEPTTLDEIVSVIRRDDPDAIIIPNLIHESEGFWAKVKNVEKKAILNTNIEAARFFKKDVFFKVGMYDENMIAYEEHDLHNRVKLLNYKICRLERIGEYITNEPNLIGYIKKYYYYGKTINVFMKKNGKYSTHIMNPFRISSIPIRLLLPFILYQLCRYSAAIIGFIVARMK